MFHSFRLKLELLVQFPTSNEENIYIYENHMYRQLVNWIMWLSSTVYKG